MSIVERALKRMQDETRPAQSHSQIFGRLVEAVRPEGPAAAQAAVPSRVITINQEGLRTAGLLPPEHQERQIANQYRQIKRPLVENAIGRAKPALPNGQIIMVASAMPGEGKTFTSINLAFSMAREKDVRVLLVDADVVKPQISKMFGIAAERGLLDALTEPGADIERLILSTDVPNLAVLPAGTGSSDQATELLASARMTALMHEVGRRDPSRIILLDSPPLLLTTESRALAQIAGQIVIVVRAGQTPQDVLLDALSYLPENANTSLILNQSVLRGESGSYYYGYGPNGGTAPS